MSRIHSHNRVASSRALTLAVAAFGLMLLGTCAPAFALSGHGHEFSFSFPGGKGEGDGQLSDPAGVAVSEVGKTAGDVYVVDRGNNRIERFGPKGEFIAAWGYGVKGGAKEYVVCKSGCQAGIPGTGKGLEKLHLGKGQLISPEAIAVDNSTSAADVSAGDVYVAADVAQAHSVVYKFSPEGEYLGHLTSKEETEELGRVDGIAVDTSGRVWIDWGGPLSSSSGTEETVEGKVVRYSSGKKVGVKETVKQTREGEEGWSVSGLGELVRPGFAVDSRDGLYLNIEPLPTFLGGEEESRDAEEGKGINGEEPCTAPSFHCGVQRITTAEEGERPAEFGESFVGSLFGETTTALASDPTQGLIYADNGGSVAEYTETGALVQRFGSGDLTQGRGLAASAASGDVYVADAAADTIEVFAPEKAGTPTVDALAAKKVTGSGAEVTAAVDPHGTKTTVSVQYGTEACGGGSCATVAGEPAEAGEGFGAVAVKATLALAPGTTYHYRVLATYTGAGGPTSVASAEQTLTTRPVALADNRSWEMVSSPLKGGAGIESLTKEGGVIQASSDGDAITYVSTSATEKGAEGNLNLGFTQNLARRVPGPGGEAQWSSHEIEIPGPEHAPGVGEGGRLQTFAYFSSDLAKALIEPVGREPVSEPPLSTQPEVTEKTLYVRQNFTEGGEEGKCSPVPASCFTPLVYPPWEENGEHHPGDTESTNFGGVPREAFSGLSFDGATPDLSRVVFSSEVPLTGEPAGTGPGANLYEWSADAPPSEQLRMVSALNSHESAAGAPELGFKGIRRGAISKTGRFVFWTGIRSSEFHEHTGPVHLFMRDVQNGGSIQIDTAEPEVATGPAALPAFQGASADGSKVFFTDAERLTKNSNAEEGKPDLYEVNTEAAEIEAGGGHPEQARITDLTPGSAGAPADVEGFVSGLSEEGTIIYYVANGRLDGSENARHETASPGSCSHSREVSATSCNLYVQQLNGETWGAPAFIATLSGADFPDWGQSERADLGEITSGTSQNGRFFAFMSQRPLTGYENKDASPAAEGARAEEVFRYEDGTGSLPGSLLCVSCRPGGEPPIGAFDTEEVGEGLGLLVDRSKVWEGGEGGASSRESHWLAGNLPGWTHVRGQLALQQPRYLTNSGRLFFNSPEPLVPADENGKNDVYEYEPGGEGTCASAEGCISLLSSGTSDRESAFLDASVSGNDVFFLTAGQLVPSDTDSSFDIYDARVCSEASPCVKPAGQVQEECKSSAGCNPALPTTLPVFSAPASLSGKASPPGSKTSTLGITEIKPPAKLTRAQLLAKALKSCKKLKKKKQRQACERTAYKKYGPKPKPKKTSAKKGKK